MGQAGSSGIAADSLRMSKKELELLVSDLNARCQQSFSSTSNIMMLFAVKYRESEDGVQQQSDSIWWKFSVKIHCFTVRNGASYCKIYCLYDFLRFHRSLTQILDASDAAPERLSFDDNVDLLQMSIFQQESSSLSGGQCIICYERMPDAVLPCTHAYCSKCVDMFRDVNQRFCPLCRYKLSGGISECWIVADKPDKQDINQYLVDSVNKRD